MPSPLDNLCGPGKPLKAEPPDANEIAGLLRTGLARLADARNTTLALESRFDLAYNAAHALCLAALRREGYRAGNRYIVFQVLPHTLAFSALYSKGLTLSSDGAEQVVSQLVKLAETGVERAAANAALVEEKNRRQHPGHAGPGHRTRRPGAEQTGRADRTENRRPGWQDRRRRRHHGQNQTQLGFQPAACFQSRLIRPF